jgi:hypothetical protein
VRSRAVRRDDSQQPAPLRTVEAELQVTLGYRALKRGVREEALHALEADPGLIPAARADHDRGAPDAQQVMEAEEGGKRRLEVAPRQDRDRLLGRVEVGAADPAHERLKVEVDGLAEVLEARHAALYGHLGRFRRGQRPQPTRLRFRRFAAAFRASAGPIPHSEAACGKPDL